MSAPIATIEGKRIAVPSVHRKKNREYLRVRVVGSAGEFVMVSTGTDSKSIALRRRSELERVIKTFGLDNPEATLGELKEYIKEFAAQWLSQPVTSDVEKSEFIDQLSDTGIKLRQIASSGSLLPSQHKAIAEAVRVIKMAQERLTGVSEALANFVEPDEPVNALAVPVAAQGVSFAQLVEEMMVEKRLTLKPASIKDLESTLRTAAKYLPAETIPQTRLEWLGVRDAMRAAGLTAGTINKIITKCSMVYSYGLLNGRLNGKNPIDKMKLNEDESKRRPFKPEEMERVIERLNGMARLNHRYLGLLGVATGARINELVQLRPSDIKESEGFFGIDINGEGDKSIKNSNSERFTPLVALKGFDLEEFREWVKGLPADKPILGMSRDTASKVFNEQVIPSVFSEEERVGLCFHSLRHSMATMCRNAGVSELDAGAIVGHKAKSITYGLYGSSGKALEAIHGALVKAFSKAGLMAS